MRQTGGLLQWITTNVTDVGATTLDEETFEGWIKDVFENGDTDERLCLCSPLLMQAISGWAKTKLQMTQDETTYGMRIYRYVTPFGDINLLMHRLLKGNTYGSYGIILDLNNIKYKALRNVLLRRNVQNRKDDEVSHEIISEVGIKVIDEKSHGIIKNFTI
jgi:predicted AlkP superfamily pyrophosphatase or phosphodiesterase